MNVIKENLKIICECLKVLIKWLLIATVLGSAGGVLGSLFHMSVDYVTEFRMHNGWVIFLLPIGGIIIAAIYGLFRSKGHIDTNRVLEAVRTDEKVPLVMIPLIFISTVLTHLFGGSAGREGAALQLGGSIGYNFGKLLRLDEKDMHLIVMSGMSSVFAALFGTPLTAAVFSLEVVNVGILHYAGLLPCIVASVVAYKVSILFGVTPVRFDMVEFSPMSVGIMARVIVLALLCALVSVMFCYSIKKCEHFMDKIISSRYLQALAGGALIVVLTVILRTNDYNGAGMDVITRAIGGSANPEAFVLKIIFTSITIAAGFKGGEIVPTFFIGSTFGCVASSLLGLDAGFGAALGFVALFCGVVNCPLASLLLSVEVFGTNGILYFAAVCAVSYMMSGNYGLYKSQKIVYSKLHDEYIDEKAK